MSAQHTYYPAGFLVQTGVQWALVGTSSKLMLLGKTTFCTQTLKSTTGMLLSVMWSPEVKSKETHDCGKAGVPNVFLPRHG